MYHAILNISDKPASQSFLPALQPDPTVIHMEFRDKDLESLKARIANALETIQ